MANVIETIDANSRQPSRTDLFKDNPPPIVWILAEHPIGSALQSALQSYQADSALYPESVEFHIYSGNESLSPDDVIVVYANNIMPSKRLGGKHAHRQGCRHAAEFRANGHRGPIILLSFEHGTLCDCSQGDTVASSNIQFTLTNDILVWYAPLYDAFVRLPAPCSTILDQIRQALVRRGHLRPLVAKAITRASASDLQLNGRNLDHQCLGLEAILRFLRGAENAWMIHPQDGREIIDHLADRVKEQHPDLEPEVRALSIEVFQMQRDRWSQYKQKLLDLQREPILRWSEYYRPYRLLMIDDDYHCLGWGKLLERILAPDGFEVLGDDGTDVESHLDDSQGPIDVILLDLGLRTRERNEVPKGFEGFDLLRSIQQAAPFTPVILFTATERMSVERQRTQLGLAGYLIKSEQVESQDARGYYERLRKVCKAALDHKIRSLLVRLGEHLEQLEPLLYTAVRPFLDRGLAEMDDPLASCYHCSLAFEAGLSSRFTTATLADKVARLRNSLNAPYPGWAQLARILRNICAHSALRTHNIKTIDAQIMGVLVVVLLYGLKKRKPSDVDSITMSELLGLVLLRCGDYLDDIINRYSGLVTTLEIRESLREAFELLRLSGSRPVQAQAVSECMDNLKQTAMLLLNLVEGGSAGLGLASLATGLRSRCVEGRESNEKLKPGYDRMGTIPFAYLHTECTNALEDAGCNDPEHMSLTALVLTRLIVWGIEQALSAPNPASDHALNAILESTPKEQKWPKAVQSAEILGPHRAAILAPGLKTLYDMGYHRLIEPTRQSFKEEIRAINTKMAHMQNRKADLERRRQPLLDDLSDFQRKRSEDEQRLRVLHVDSDRLGTQKGIGGTSIRKLAELQNAIQKIVKELAHYDTDIVSVKKRLAKIDDEMSDFEETMRGMQARQAQLEEILKRWSTSTAASDLQPLLIQIASGPFLSDTAGEIAIARECLNNWIWTEECTDLPLLFSILDNIWEQRGQLLSES